MSRSSACVGLLHVTTSVIGATFNSAVVGAGWHRQTGGSPGARTGSKVSGLAWKKCRRGVESEAELRLFIKPNNKTTIIVAMMLLPDDIKVPAVAARMDFFNAVVMGRFRARLSHAERSHQETLRPSKRGWTSLVIRYGIWALSGNTSGGMGQ